MEAEPPSDELDRPAGRSTQRANTPEPQYAEDIPYRERATREREPEARPPSPFPGAPPALPDFEPPPPERDLFEAFDETGEGQKKAPSRIELTTSEAASIRKTDATSGYRFLFGLACYAAGAVSCLLVLLVAGFFDQAPRNAAAPSAPVSAAPPATVTVIVREPAVAPTADSIATETAAPAASTAPAVRTGTLPQSKTAATTAAPATTTAAPAVTTSPTATTTNTSTFDPNKF